MYKHILVPIAPSQDRQKSPAMDIARLLKAPGGKISVLSVLEEIPSYVEAYVPPAQLEKNAADLHATLKATVGADDVELHVVAGHSANTILDWTKTHDVDCIILSSHRPDLSDYILGSTASRVVRHAQCSVIVMR